MPHDILDETLNDVENYDRPSDNPNISGKLFNKKYNFLI